MDAFMKLSREAQVVIGGSLLLLIIMFFDWQQVTLGPYGSYGANAWHGVGFFAGLLIIGLLVWEGVRLFGNVTVGSLDDGVLSAVFALLSALFIVIYFLTHGTARHWPAWIGLLLAIVVAVFAVMRARAEEVKMPAMGGSSSGGSTASSGSEMSSSSSDGDAGGSSDAEPEA